eukprot:CAMPEP_0195529802 /NCGR_PEP_ID=MMETSP0794_2-20130614/32450_1 /TAXON_ID=515487 /ORGANISM="Stephanopyxis turris, Strain CCMP 815" /LENGTH=308 /DNA_ID=CAMNT_0040661161 /DNA_START=232 /DNA_END=1158 /DNA_ORIENTATION=+
MRGWMSAARSYLPPVKLGTPMRASCIGRIIASDSPERFPESTMVLADEGCVQCYARIEAANLRFVHALRLDSIPVTVRSSAFLSVLGITGLTAYFGFLRKGMPQAGDTVLVSGAAGATGSVVSQIARLKGCRVIGTAGTDAKCRWLEESQIVDVAINYKTASSSNGSLARAIRNACPTKRGVDIVFDNVGGEFLDAALSNLNRGARVVLCGAISQYNSDEGVQGPRNYMSLLVNRATMSGFVVFDYKSEYRTAIAELSGWVASGQVKFSEDIVHGVENFLAALTSLFDGSNKGKVILKASSEQLRSKL